MKTNEIIASLRCCVVTQFTSCKECPAYARGPGCINRLHTAAADTLETQQKRIEELEAERRWIPVTERLPERFQPVLICREKEPGKRIVEQGCKDLGDWWRVYGTRVKRIRFWMPLPEPPKEATPCP